MIDSNIDIVSDTAIELPVFIAIRPKVSSRVVSASSQLAADSSLSVVELVSPILSDDIVYSYREPTVTTTATFVHLPCFLPVIQGLRFALFAEVPSPMIEGIDSLAFISREVAHYVLAVLSYAVTSLAKVIVHHGA